MIDLLAPDIDFTAWVSYYVAPQLHYETGFAHGSNVLLILTHNGVVPGYFIQLKCDCKISGIALLSGDGVYIDLKGQLIKNPLCYYETLIINKTVDKHLN